MLGETNQPKRLRNQWCNHDISTPKDRFEPLLNQRFASKGWFAALLHVVNPKASNLESAANCSKKPFVCLSFFAFPRLAAKKSCTPSRWTEMRELLLSSPLSRPWLVVNIAPYPRWNRKRKRRSFRDVLHTSNRLFAARYLLKKKMNNTMSWIWVY